MTGLLDRQRRLQRQLVPDRPDPQHDLDYLTNFERKYHKEGRPIYRALYWKVEG
jgi:tRNA (guanine-N7-)-methyltransferase